MDGLVARVRRRSKDHHVGILAAGVAFYLMLALFPAQLAIVSLYGLVADPNDVEALVRSLSAALPSSVVELVSERLHSLVGRTPSSLGIGLVVSVLLALWSASSGCKALMEALDVAYGTRESRGFVKMRARALMLTAALAVAGVVALFVITVLPASLASLGATAQVRDAAALVRWPVLGALGVVGLASLYRWGPDRAAPPISSVLPGAVLAIVLWIAASLGLSLYTSYSGRMDATYGALAGVIVLLLWLFVSSFAVLLGAELNRSLELRGTSDENSVPRVREPELA